METNVELGNLIRLDNWNPNVEEIAERCFIGPQGELMEQIETFNNHYRRWSTVETPLAVTKRFYLKPGVYANIKEIYSNHINQFGIKPRGLRSLKERIHNSSWATREFWSSLMDIDSKMFHLRNQNASWLDNTEVVTNYVTELSDNIEEQLEKVHQMYPNLKMFIGIDNEGTTNDDASSRTKLVLKAILSDINLIVKYDGGLLAEIPTNDVMIQEHLSIWPHINTHCIPNARRDRGSIYNTRVIQEDMYELEHPFIHKRNNWNRVNGADAGWRGICKGDHQSPWTNSLWHLDLMAYAHYFTNWATKYEIPSTNPLNRINACFFGLPGGVTNAVLQIPSEKPLTETLNKRAERCDFPSRFAVAMSRLMGRTGWKEEYYNQDYIENDMINHCDTCQLKSLNRCRPVELTLYPFIDNIEVDWESSDYHNSLDDNEFQVQQIWMHKIAKNMMSYGDWSDNFEAEDVQTWRQRQDVECCLTEIDQLSRSFTPDRPYPIDWHWQDCVRAHVGFTNYQLIKDFLNSLDGDTVLFSRLRDDWCHRNFNINYDALSDDDMYHCDEELQGHDTLSLQKWLDDDTARNNAAMADANQEVEAEFDINSVFPNTEPVPEEELTIQQRMLQRAAARGGAFSLNR